MKIKKQALPEPLHEHVASAPSMARVDCASSQDVPATYALDHIATNMYDSMSLTLPVLRRARAGVSAANTAAVQASACLAAAPM